MLFRHLINFLEDRRDGTTQGCDATRRLGACESAGHAVRVTLAQRLFPRRNACEYGIDAAGQNLSRDSLQVESIGLADQRIREFILTPGYDGHPRQLLLVDLLIRPCILHDAQGDRGATLGQIKDLDQGFVSETQTRDGLEGQAGVMQIGDPQRKTVNVLDGINRFRGPGQIGRHVSEGVAGVKRLIVRR